MTPPKILLVDIETSPLKVWTFGTKNVFVSLEQIIEDTFMLSWAAKWVGGRDMLFMRQTGVPKAKKEKPLLRKLYALLKEADIVVAHNLNGFDHPYINARLMVHNFKPPTSYRREDTLSISRKYARFTSHKLQHLLRSLCSAKKDAHAAFPGFLLHKGVMEGNERAWKAMEKYNKKDVLGLEELYTKLKPWDTTSHIVYDGTCKCGSSDAKRQGWYYTATRRYQRWKCKDCGWEWREGKHGHGLVTR